MLSINKTIRALSFATLLGSAALLSGCGGGGAVPPTVATAPPPAFTAFPTTLTLYSGTPAVVTVVSGVAPIQAFTSDNVALPVTQNVAGAAVTLVASAVEADRPVALTLRDGLGREIAIAVNIKPSPLLGEMTIIPAEGTDCANQTPSGTPGKDNASFCSGETATARITVRGSGSTPIANRQIRYDVVQGAYNFVIDQAGTVLSKTATIVTDQNGQAIVTIKSDAPTPTQVALIRATDLVSGNRVDGSFTIVQSVGGSPSFNTSPKEATFTGFYDDQCGSGSVRFVIFGGTPPYNVVANNVSVAYPTLSTQFTVSSSVVVAKSGDFFFGVTPGGLCSGKREGLFTITDAAGQVITAKITSDKGTVKLPEAPPPTTLVVTPPELTVASPSAAAACPSSIVQFVVTGGTAPYTANSSSPTKANLSPLSATPTPPAFTSPLRIQTTPLLLPGDTVVFAVTDGGTQVKTATIKCVAPAAP